MLGILSGLYAAATQKHVVLAIISIPWVVTQVGAPIPHLALGPDMGVCARSNCIIARSNLQIQWVSSIFTLQQLTPDSPRLFSSCVTVEQLDVGSLPRHWVKFSPDAANTALLPKLSQFFDQMWQLHRLEPNPSQIRDQRTAKPGP